MKLRAAELRGIKRNSSVAEYPPSLACGELRKGYSPRLAYSAEAAASAVKAGHPRSKLRGIRRRRIKAVTTSESFLPPSLPISSTHLQSAAV